MTTLDALATFLTARWDEVEGDHYAIQPSDFGDFDTPVGGCVPCGVQPPRECATLADLAAKRAILAEAVAYMPELEHGDNGEWAVEMVVHHLAAPFRDHPDHPANQEA